MKKLIPFILLLLSISHIAFAQLKLYVYENNGETTEFIASNVDSIAFTAPGTYPVDPNSDDYIEEFIDLGLSVRWAPCNIGANRPERYGDYFAWGETSIKSNYNISNYIWFDIDSGTIIKYCTDDGVGTLDYNIILDVSDDAARVNWGNGWRIPTMEEFNELIDNCDINWTKLNNVGGCKFTSKINGKSIFLPASGYMASSDSSVGELGYYWTATLDVKDPSRAMQFMFNYKEHQLNSTARFFGQPIRPVIP